jgi:hypothetical protein
MGVSGAVKNGNLIMYDKATDTWYLQETGEAISEKTGLALKGTQNDGRLIELDDSMRTLNVRWDVWSKEHPDSKVLFCDHCETEHSKH